MRICLDQPDLTMMLDSGAFSAWTQKKEITTQEYADFIQDRGAPFKFRANLDVIPGTRGRRPTIAQANEAAEQSWANYEWLEHRGCGVFPVYHYGEDPKWLKRILDSGALFFGLGGLVWVPKRERRVWLDYTWAIIRKHREPFRAVHGFGLTDFELMRRYEWHSVDSMSWLILSTTGVIYIPTGSERVLTITMSNDVKERISGFDALGPNERRVVLDWIAKIGSNETALRSSYLERGYANIMAMFHILRNRETKVFLTASSRGYDEVLRRAKSQHRLMSFFDLRRTGNFDLEVYAATGCSKTAKGK